MARDYYEVLGVPKGAGTDEIQQAYRKLARKYHPPDVNKDPTAEDRFKEVNEAYQVLSDPDTRKRYDRFGDDFRHVPRITTNGCGQTPPGTAVAGDGCTSATVSVVRVPSTSKTSSGRCSAEAVGSDRFPAPIRRPNWNWLWKSLSGRKTHSQTGRTAV